MLLDYGIKDDPTSSETEDYIKNRIDNFFNEDNFHQPAISKNDSYEEDYSKKDIWDDISSDETSVGFYYLIGEENGRHVAYSKKLKKVVVYFNCC